MPEIAESAQRGLTRRTALKGAAWSVPVVAAAIAVPAYAASGDTADLQLSMSSGDVLEQTSPDGTRQWTMTHPSTFAAYSDAEVAAGSILTVSFDIRIVSGVDVTLGDTPLTASSTDTTGNVQTSTYAVPVAIPVSDYNTSTVRFRVSAGLVDPLPWAEDLNPYIVSIAAPGMTDPNTANNSVVSAVQYSDVTP
ncbi:MULTISPECIES: hypothetical protein [unclassified Microbacterium]|uniref:hypothetical protein n=1 Tax=unclassified Microbacterium TaxID=2609290 RepID=UPI0012FADF1A|nr:hypothetical protein [Microbacterium sp. MAH-37]MVQ41642.1 hypothetical protein [Microbacterium sp. MAH-37]